MSIKSPSVTTVLGVFTAWHKIPANILKMAIDRGNAVHNAAQAKLENIFYTLPAEYQNYLVSFERWFEKYVARVFFVEKRFEDPLFGFNGKPDLGCELKYPMFQSERRPQGYQWPIIDIKTGQAEGQTWCGQGAAYHHLCNQVEQKYDCSIFLQLSPKGDWPKVRLYEYVEKDFAAFLSALIAYKYFKKRAIGLSPSRPLFLLMARRH
jgi:hypothetical protein